MDHCELVHERCAGCQVVDGVAVELVGDLGDGHAVVEVLEDLALELIRDVGFACTFLLLDELVVDVPEQLLTVLFVEVELVLACGQFALSV